MNHSNGSLNVASKKRIIPFLLEILQAEQYILMTGRKREREVTTEEKQIVFTHVFGDIVPI